MSDNIKKNLDYLKKEMDKALEEVLSPTFHKLAPNEYRCAVCRQIFNKGLSDEEAAEAYKKEFPNDPPLEHIETDLVCEDCFNNLKTVGAFDE